MVLKYTPGTNIQFLKDGNNDDSEIEEIMEKDLTLHNIVTTVAKL